MYTVSDAYKEAINGRSRQFRIRAVIDFRDGTTKTFDDSTVIGEVTISSQMMPGSPSDDMIKIGMAASKKLTMTVKNVKTDLHVFSGARVLLYVSLQLKSGEYEEIPMGKFRIDSKSISRVNDLVTFSAYDDMVLLQYALTNEMRKELKGKTALEAARILCDGLLLVGTAVSPAGGYVECPNADIPLDFGSEQVETARDGIMWIAQIMGCFARVNRLGVLEFVPIKSWWKMYTETTGTILAVRNIGGAQRIRTKFADDRIHIVGVSMRGTDGKLVTQRYSYSNPAGGDPTSDVTVEMETNPLIMNGSVSVKKVLENILEQVSTAYFYAFSTEIPNDPALDEGDTIRLQGGIINGTNHNNDLIGFITHNVWRYRGIQEITNASSVPIMFGREDSAAAVDASDTASARSSDDLNYLPPRPQSEKALQGVSMSELVGNFVGRYTFKWDGPYALVAIDNSGKPIYRIQIMDDTLYIQWNGSSSRLYLCPKHAELIMNGKRVAYMDFNRPLFQMFGDGAHDGITIQADSHIEIGGWFQVNRNNGAIYLNGQEVFRNGSN